MNGLGIFIDASAIPVFPVLALRRARRAGPGSSRPGPAWKAFPVSVLLVCAGFAWTAPDAAMVAEWDAAAAIPGSILPDGSGHGHDGILRGAHVERQMEALGDPSAIRFDGAGSYVEVPYEPALNPSVFTLVAWFARDGAGHEQQPLIVKSAPRHADPWYQYGIFILDTPEHPAAAALSVCVGGRLVSIEACDVLPPGGWTAVAATVDGRTARLYVNGRLAAETNSPGGTADHYETPLFLGAYANLPKIAPYCFAGRIGYAAIYSRALAPEEILAAYESRKAAYPQETAQQVRTVSEYERRVHEALRQPRDVWGEQLIAQGGATYESIKDYLQPLFYSTGFTNTELGPHNLVFAFDGGPEPYLVPLATGRRIAANIITSGRFIECAVGGDGELYGDDLKRLAGPFLDGSYYPILQTAYEARDGVRYEQESFGGAVAGLDHIAAYLKLTARTAPGSPGRGRICLKLGEPATNTICVAAADGGGGSCEVRADAVECVFDLTDGNARSLFVIWSPRDPLPPNAGALINEAAYEAAKAACKQYWDERLARGARFAVPEPLVMDCQRNLLVQNLIMRWRYSLGSVVYSGSFYQPESNDAAATLGLFGYLDAFRDGVATLNRLTKGKEDRYFNWECGEKLSHGAHYYHLSKDTGFVAENTPLYEEYCRDFVRQMETDPLGLLRPERQCGDIPEVGYYPFQQAVCWRGMRDMAAIWKETGRQDLHALFSPAAERLRQSLLKNIALHQRRLPDGTLFIPRVLKPEAELYDPVTETRLGSYWNLIQPYTFDSGLWDPLGDDMRDIVRFMHEHGSLLLGLLRFNYYPTPIGTWRRGGLPGYYTSGFDNVYLPSYLRVIADRDEADRLILSFYGKLAHGQTRNTFVCGEGDTAGPRPAEEYRSMYGSPCSANNAVFLVALRQMLVRESFARETGWPEHLYLAHATPRQWLEDGKNIRVENAPTCFGPVSFAIVSHIGAGLIEANVQIPARNPIHVLKLKLRAPGNRVLRAVRVNGDDFPRFDKESEVIDLSGLSGYVEVAAHYE